MIKNAKDIRQAANEIWQPLLEKVYFVHFCLSILE